MTTISLVSRMPDQQKRDFKDEDYINTLRFLSQCWNFNNNTFINLTPSAGGNTIPSVENNYGFSYRYFENVSYLFGSQTPTDFGFFIQDINGNSTRVPMYRGRDVTKYFNFIMGKVREMLKPLPRMVNVVAYSENAQSVKKTTMNMVAFRFEQQENIASIQAMTGLGFEPVDGIDYSSDFDYQKRMQSFQDVMEQTYEYLAKDGLYKNQYEKRFVKGGEDVFISGAACIKISHDNGRINWKNIKLNQLIMDTSKEDPLHDDDDYAGEVCDMTLNEVLTTWEWNKEETEDITNMANNPSMWATYNTILGINGMYWWTASNGIPKITAVRGEWRSMKFVDGVWVETLRQGTLIGNKYLKDNRESEGQVWDIYDKRKKKLSYRIVTPNTRLGAVEGVVGIIKRFQDVKDAFITKAIALASSAIGKAYFINANKLPEGLKAPDILSQLKQAGIVVTEGADIDDLPENKMQKTIEPIDMTIDPSIGVLLDFSRYFDNAIADMLNIPNEVRGQQNNYQSKDVYSSNLAQSEYGMKWFYDNLMMWVEGILSYHANLAKVVLPETKAGRDNLALTIGGAATQLISMEEVKKIQFEDFLLKLIPDDIVGATEKKEFMQLALQLASSGMFSMADYVKLRKMDNIRDMENYFELVEIKRQERERQAQEAQLAAAQQNTERVTQGQENIAATQTEGKLIDREMQMEQALQQQAMQQPQ